MNESAGVTMMGRFGKKGSEVCLKDKFLTLLCYTTSYTICISEESIM